MPAQPTNRPGIPLNASPGRAVQRRNRLSGVYEKDFRFIHFLSSCIMLPILSHAFSMHGRAGLGQHAGHRLHIGLSCAPSLPLPYAVDYCIRFYQSATQHISHTRNICSIATAWFLAHITSACEHSHHRTLHGMHHTLPHAYMTGLLRYAHTHCARPTHTARTANPHTSCMRTPCTLLHRKAIPTGEPDIVRMIDAGPFDSPISSHIKLPLSANCPAVVRTSGRPTSLSTRCMLLCRVHT